MDSSLVPEVLKLGGAIFTLGWGSYRIWSAPKPLVQKVVVQVMVSYAIAVVLLALTHFNRLGLF